MSVSLGMVDVMQTVRVSLRISARRFQAYYEGVVDSVVAKAEDGRTVQFPARVLRPFLSHRGIEGVFDITFSASQKFQAITRVNEGRGFEA
ncbi:MAG: DUF2835 domain-containing protein [Nitrospirales bacterium]|nr:DUF2835 domain-containing protein [Nitrospira sp.]MCA9481709.1 DUF2835 domain-containing protein [Nitrospira sp.]MDR4487816.1 DUF2835 domain-containing protein [Nitrospirales bacterium]